MVSRQIADGLHVACIPAVEMHDGLHDGLHIPVHSAQCSVAFTCGSM